ncbi:hypothetical protein CEP54_014909 [Fusarium duplospermum]|uniref:DUF924-domain-containing protein n=1 Tax=Fusarium duplospermum TaxID=1325734 RepID=A0A428NSW6_9HYPO|nr:hypothetical protein CEP54_014909 [Fusarium duplospermum]
MAPDPQTVVERPVMLNHSLLDRVRQFWFRHITDDHHLIVSDKEEALVWFSQNDEFDQECISNFGPILDFLSSESNRIGVDYILHATNPTSALDWMSLIILLDQIPRNCYRGEKAAVAYRFFDPMVLGLAFRAIATGIPERPELRHRHSYRFWFYLPLEHCENVRILQGVVREHDLMFEDSRQLMDGHVSASLQGPDALYCRDVLIRRRESLKVWEATLRGIVKDHIAVLGEHGRYPHRDRALGRDVNCNI